MIWKTSEISQGESKRRKSGRQLAEGAFDLIKLLIRCFSKEFESQVDPGRFDPPYTSIAQCLS
jgi:hypothetical protein